MIPLGVVCNFQIYTVTWRNLSWAVSGVQNKIGIICVNMKSSHCSGLHHKSIYYIVLNRWNNTYWTFIWGQVLYPNDKT